MLSSLRAGAVCCAGSPRRGEQFFRSGDVLCKCLCITYMSIKRGCAIWCSTPCRARNSTRPNGVCSVRI